MLRGLLLTGFAPRFLRAEATRSHSLVDFEPLWWPPAKIVGRYLTPLLAAELGLAESVVGPVHDGAPVHGLRESRSKSAARDG